ncbi:MAG: NADP-dependent oxidoreductase [Rectinemataceae bacterium]
MKAVRIEGYGDASVIEVKSDTPKPKAGPGQVLVEVHAASLNPVDSMVRLGYMKEMAPLEFPATLGGDLAGVVVELGPGVEGLKVGDRVYGMGSAIAGASGAFAEYAAVSAGQLAPMPSKLGFVEAASLPLIGVSALQALTEHIKLKSGDRILIHGGAGGIGSAAIQLAKHLGARVTTTVHGEGAAFAKKLGADEILDADKAGALGALEGFDSMLETTRADLYKSTLGALKKGGVLVSMSGPPDAALATKQGVTAIGQGTQVNTERLKRLSDLVARGAIKPQVDRVFPLEKAREAFVAREAGKVRGKIVLEVK